MCRTVTRVSHDYTLGRLSFCQLVDFLVRCVQSKILGWHSEVVDETESLHWLQRKTCAKLHDKRHSPHSLVISKF